MIKKRLIFILFILTIGIIFVVAAVDKTKQWHPADTDVKLLVDGSEKTLQQVIDGGLFLGTHTYASLSSAPASGHNADAIWVSVKDGEMNLVQALSSTNQLYPVNPLETSYTGPADKSKAYHHATEIEVTSGGSAMSLQEAINSNKLCYTWDTWVQKISVYKEWRGIAMSSDGKYQAIVTTGGSATDRFYVSSDFGNTWTPKINDINRVWSKVAISSDGRIQTVLDSGYGRMYVSTDSGNTWNMKYTSGAILTGVAMSSDGKYQTVTAGGGASGKIYVSTDSGNTWALKDNSGNRFSGVAMSSDGKIQAAIVGNGWGGVYISTDSGNTWTKKTISGNPEYLTGIAMSSDGKIQTAVAGGTSKKEKIYVSTDSGNTWTAKESNRRWTGIAMSSDGKIQTAVAAGMYYETPPSDRIYVSTDSGNTWTAKGDSRGWYGIAMSSDGKIQSAVVYGGYVYSSVGN